MSTLDSLHLKNDLYPLGSSGKAETVERDPDINLKIMVPALRKLNTKILAQPQQTFYTITNII